MVKAMPLAARASTAAGPGSGTRIRSAGRTLRLLEILGAADEPLPLSELSRRMNVAPPTLHHVLSTLLQDGYVHQDRSSRRYRVGLRLVRLAADVLRRTDLTREAIPVMRRFVEATGEHVTLAVLDDGTVAPLHTEESPEAPRLFVRFGRRAPLHSTALGKVLLAWRPEREVARLLGTGPLPKLTPRTITGRRRLLRELARVRRAGVAVDDQETLLGARCLAVPVRNHRDEVVAALSTSGPASLWTPARTARLRALLRAAGDEISHRLGYGRAASLETKEVS